MENVKARADPALQVGPREKKFGKSKTGSTKVKVERGGGALCSGVNRLVN